MVGGTCPEEIHGNFPQFPEESTRNSQAWHPPISVGGGGNDVPPRGFQCRQCINDFVISKARILFGILAIGLGMLLLLEVVVIPTSLQSETLPVRFLEYSDPAGRSAVFELSNQSGSTVVVLETADFIRSPGNREERQNVEIQRTEIQKGQVGRILIPVAGEEAWQVEFQVAKFKEARNWRVEQGKPLKSIPVLSDVVPARNADP